MKRIKQIFILLVAFVVVFAAGITYSLLTSRATSNINQEIAEFIFNAEVSDKLYLLLNDLKPGDEQEHFFSISNKSDEKVSEVTIEYQIIIKTFHLIPLDINLYKLEGENETLLLKCDETYRRNDQNELVCNVPVQTMSFSSDTLDNYKIKISFPSSYSLDISYSEIVDYLNLEIKSWQKI